MISHQAIPRKVDLIKRLLALLVLPAPEHYRVQLRRLSALTNRGCADLAIKATLLLVGMGGGGVEHGGREGV